MLLENIMNKKTQIYSLLKVSEKITTKWNTFWRTFSFVFCCWFSRVAISLLLCMPSRLPPFPYQFHFAFIIVLRFAHADFTTIDAKSSSFIYNWKNGNRCEGRKEKFARKMIQFVCLPQSGVLFDQKKLVFSHHFSTMNRKKKKNKCFSSFSMTRCI